MKFRAFIAVRLSEDSTRELSRLSAGLSGRDKKNEIRWIPEENFHLTLAFLGDILQSDAVRLESALISRLDDVESFHVQGVSLSYFPLNAKPRLVAAMMRTGEDLLRLQRRTQAALRDTGLPVESRAFVPHVTLGRVRHRRTPWLRIEPEPIDLAFDVSSVELMRSELDTHGARYSPVFSVGLSEASV